jgi:drug/metabolite transporter (DMT)-like permease
MDVSSLSELFHHHSGEFAAAFMAICATCSIVAWTSSSHRIGVMAVCVLRLTAASLMLAFWGGFAHGHWLPLDADGKTWLVLMISGFFGYFLADMSAIKAFVVIGPRLTLLLGCVAPLMVTVGGYFYLGEKIGPINLLGIAITLAGVIWAILERPDNTMQAIPRKELVYGVSLALASAVFSSIGTIFAKQGVGNLDPFAATQIRILAALACYPLLVTLLGRWKQIGRAVRDFSTMRIILIGTLFGPFLGMALYMYALQHCASAGIVCTISSTSPILILPFCVLLYKERVSLRATFGAVISVVGVTILMF